MKPSCTQVRSTKTQGTASFDALSSDLTSHGGEDVERTGADNARTVSKGQLSCAEMGANQTGADARCVDVNITYAK